MVEKNEYDFILVNYANADMVGHTGNEERPSSPVRLPTKAFPFSFLPSSSTTGPFSITADHGNAEELKNLETGEIDTEHSVNPCLSGSSRPIITARNRPMRWSVNRMKSEASSSDVAPTILDLMGIKKPVEMNGNQPDQLFQ